MASTEPVEPASQVSAHHVEPHPSPSNNEFVFEPAVKVLTTPSEQELDKAMRKKRAGRLGKLREQRLSMFRKAHYYHKKSGWKVGVFFYHPSRNKHYAYVTVPKPGLGEKVSPEQQFPPSINRIRKKLPKADLWFPEDAADPENPGQEIQRQKLFIRKYSKRANPAQAQKNVGPVYPPVGNILPSPSSQSAWSATDPFQAGVAPQPFLSSPFQPRWPTDPIANQLQPVVNPFGYPQPFLQSSFPLVRPGNLAQPGQNAPSQQPGPLQDIQPIHVRDNVAQFLTDSEFDGSKSEHDSSEDVSDDSESDDSATDDEHEDGDMASAYSETEEPGYQGQAEAHGAKYHTPALPSPGCVSDEHESVDRMESFCDEVHASAPRAGSHTMAASTTPESSGCPVETPPNWVEFRTPPMSDYMSTGSNAPDQEHYCAPDDLRVDIASPILVQDSPGSGSDDDHTREWIGAGLRSTPTFLSTPASDYPLAPLFDSRPTTPAHCSAAESGMAEIEPRKVAPTRQSARQVVATRSRVNSAMDTGRGRLARAAKSRSRGRPRRATPSTKASSKKPLSPARHQEPRDSRGSAESSRHPGNRIRHTQFFIDLPVLTAEQKAEYVKVDWE